ncbi:DnaJ-domain-containing protein [Irpex rosettiformis]|uniref:DnaJ-domain-containing protein n=1 Tax=Irpex rosettiformis TaxID=378272 RepID=A0ACB8UAN1_9APHY|nr:DnaJ-domain-containing protein [Irpex rosettiformis]
MPEQASSSSSTPSKTPTPAPDVDIEKLLNREANAFQRELEVERILKAFKLNPYEILDIDESATTEEIKKKYRQLSLFIHPDKTPHARAPDAFDLLKKAESELSDEKLREELDAIVKQARNLVLKNLNLPATIKGDDARLKDVTPPFKQQVRAKSKELLIDEEVRRRKAVKMNLANEGLEAKKKEEEVNAKKRKAEEDAQWEANREQRVGSWRNFANSNKKKKKTKGAVLG